MRSSIVIRRLAVSTALLAATPFLAGCGQFDTVAGFKIVNDTPRPVVVKQCGNSCQQIVDQRALDPGQSIEENVTVGGPSEDYLIGAATPAGMGWRCLSVLIETDPTHEPSVLASSARPCPTS